MMRKPYTLTRWEQELDIGLDQYVDDLQKRNFTFDHFLSYIKGVSSWTMRDVIRIPAMVPTRQVTWALALARAELTDFLLDWNIECEVKANKAYCNTIQLETSRLLNDSIIKSMLPLSAQKPWDDLLRMIIAKAKSVR
ncbi:hypothetical protein D3C77_619830 [compost metagenome]